MIRLTVLAGRQAGESVVGKRFPFTVGRAAGCGLRLEDPGVWGTHATIRLDAAEGFVVEGHPEGGVGVNGLTVPRQRLQNGDVLQLGGARIRFGLSETTPKSFRVREWLTWLAVVLLCLGQMALIHLVLP